MAQALTVDRARPIVAVVQARMGSTRLPGKALLPIDGKPLLQRIVERAGQARLVDHLMIATTTSRRDAPIATLSRRLDILCFRGAEDDVLDRFYRAALQAHAVTVVRLTADNPLVDGRLIDWTIQHYLDADVDYADTVLSGTFPYGASVEVFSFEALRQAWQDGGDAGWREHVTPFIYRNPGRFRILNLICPRLCRRYRLTVDTDEDLELMRRIFERFHERQDFGWDDAVTLLECEPELAARNQCVEQRWVE